MREWTTINISTSTTSVNEGSSITFNISSTNAENYTPYWGIYGAQSLSDDTGYALDDGLAFNTGDLTNQIDFARFEINSLGTGTVTIPLAADQLTEGDEYFYLFAGLWDSSSSEYVARDWSENILAREVMGR